MSKPVTLMEHLNAIYAAKYLHKGNRESAVATLKQALSKDNTLWAQALARQAQLLELQRSVGGDLNQRDVIGAVHLEALNEVLSS